MGCKFSTPATDHNDWLVTDFAALPYGRLDIGDYPQPQVLYRQPIAIQRVPMDRPPIYLRVPPGHTRHWSKHCREHVPRYREQDRDRRDERRDENRKIVAGTTGATATATIAAMDVIAKASA